MKYEQYKNGAIITVHSGGPRGPKGEVGPKGDTGEKGPQGIQGPKGKDGYTPVKGVDYFDGEKGDKGEQGDPGFYNLQSIMEDTKGKTLSDFVDVLKFLGINPNYELLTIDNYQDLTPIDPSKTYFIKKGEQI